MALKDLIARSAALTEEAIEGIVKNYVTYDPEAKELGFLPAAAGLSAKDKVLVYLVALQGWPFVTEEPVPTEMKPAELQERLNIPGGTLRPMLVNLKERHLLASEKGAYSVRAAALAGIQEELNGQGHPVRRAARRPAAKRAATEDADAPKGKTKAAKNKTGTVSARFTSWIDEGWFDEPKTLAQARERFRKEGIIIPMTSMPHYFLSALHAHRLVREEIDVRGKKVWVYQTRK